MEYTGHIKNIYITRKCKYWERVNLYNKYVLLMSYPSDKPKIMIIIYIET